MPLHTDIFPFRGPQKKTPRLDLISPYGFVDSISHQAELQRASQSSPALSAQSRASSQTTYYSYHSGEHDLVSSRDGTSMIESTYSLVSTAECATARAEESEADKPVSGGKGFHLPKFKLSLSASPPKPKPKMQPPTPRSGVSFGRGGAGNSFRASSNKSPTTPTVVRRHKASNSDPSGIERLSMHTEATLDYTSDGDTYTTPRRRLSTRASRWSLEPLRDQGLASRSSLESEWMENNSVEQRQYATPMEVSTSAGFGGVRGTARSFPIIPPDAGRSRWEEQRQEGRDSLGSAVSTFGFSSATELGGFSRTSGDPRIMRSSESLDLDRHEIPFPFAISSHHLKNPPPSYDEATDRLTPMDQRDRRHLDDAQLYPHHAAYDAPLHQPTYQTPRPLPTIPRRYDRCTAPMEPVYLDHPRSKEGQSPLLYRSSMKKPAVTFSSTSECSKERPHSRLSTAQYTNKPLYHRESALPEAFHTCTCHQHPVSRVLDEHPEENDTVPRHSLGGYQQRSITPIADPAPPCTSLPELATPDQVTDADIATVSQTSVGTASVPSPSLRPATMQGSDSTCEGSQEQPKKLSKVERALLRQAKRCLD